MTTASLSPTLQDLLADLLDIPPGQVTLALTTNDAEAWDSFTHLQIVLAIEAQYGIKLDPQRIPALTSVQLLQNEIAAKGATP